MTRNMAKELEEKIGFRKMLERQRDRRALV